MPFIEPIILLLEIAPPRSISWLLIKTPFIELIIPLLDIAAAEFALAVVLFPIKLPEILSTVPAVTYIPDEVVPALPIKFPVILSIFRIFLI